MKLVIAIVDMDNKNKLSFELNKQKFDHTRFASNGGSNAKAGTTTFFIGCSDEEVDDVVRMINDNCRPEEIANSQDDQYDTSPTAPVTFVDPSKSKKRGATVIFVLDVYSFIKE